MTPKKKSTDSPKTPVKAIAATARKPAPKPSPKKPGPAPETLKLEGDWQANVAKSLTKKKPAEGWPKE